MLCPSPGPVRYTFRVVIYTIGHSTRTLEELVGLLKENEIELLADIRSHPVSKRRPQFNREDLARRLPDYGIEYRWLGQELGGFRDRRDPNSPHTALRNPRFRNYADHTASEEFAQGIEALIALARHKRVALMCAEVLWWRCHRSLVSDYLTACRGIEVTHILGAGKRTPHRLHRAARQAGGKLVYDVAEQPRLL